MDALDALHEEIRTHTGCGFEICEQATNIVPGEGDHSPAVLLVGEAPGASEDKQGRPFVGRAGKLLDTLLAEAGVERADVFITNVVKARPPGNRDPRADEVAHHRPWLDAQLQVIAPEVVVPLGRHAMGHFLSGPTITEAHGQVVEADGRRVLPWFHPAAALHNQRLRETLFADARALRDAL
jgi:uracil-DNA glycosylase